MIYLLHRFISSPVPFRTTFYDVCNALPLINNSCVALFLKPPHLLKIWPISWTEHAIKH